MTVPDTAAAELRAQAHPQQAPAAPAAGRSSLGDVCAVLWPPPATTSVARGRAAHADERDFILPPSARHPRLLVPDRKSVV